jgi:TetR/AcrR family transcriptional regulator, cholesterol catabolism regulator
MEEKEHKIIQGAARVFMKYGIKSVNMDDLARHLAVSKKTLYLYVKDKEDILRRAVLYFCKEEDDQINGICSLGLNAIDESLEIMKWVVSILRNVHPSVNYDMEKYFPEISKTMHDNRFKAVYQCLSNNIRKGQKEGLYRKDINADVIVKMYITRMDVMFDQHLFPLADYNLADIYAEMFRYHIRGIASNKGHEYLAERIKSLK